MKDAYGEGEHLLDLSIAGRIVLFLLLFNPHSLAGGWRSYVQHVRWRNHLGGPKLCASDGARMRQGLSADQVRLSRSMSIAVP